MLNNSLISLHSLKQKGAHFRRVSLINSPSVKPFHAELWSEQFWNLLMLNSWDFLRISQSNLIDCCWEPYSFLFSLTFFPKGQWWFTSKGLFALHVLLTVVSWDKRHNDLTFLSIRTYFSRHALWRLYHSTVVVFLIWGSSLKKLEH